MKGDQYYWYLALTILCLGFEGIFTLAIKESQEWRFFCPSVFLYLARSIWSLMKHMITSISTRSVCPSIWLIELDKLDKRLAAREAREAFLSSNMTTLPPTTTESRIIVCHLRLKHFLTRSGLRV